MSDPDYSRITHLPDNRVWVFKPAEDADPYERNFTMTAKSLVNQRDDVDWENLVAKKMGGGYRKPARIVVVEVKDDE